MNETTMCTGCLAGPSLSGWVASDVTKDSNLYCLNCGGHGIIITLPEVGANQLRMNHTQLVSEHHASWDELSIKIGKSRTLCIKYKVANFIYLPSKWLRKRRKYSITNRGND